MHLLILLPTPNTKQQSTVDCKWPKSATLQLLTYPNFNHLLVISVVKPTECSSVSKSLQSLSDHICDYRGTNLSLIIKANHCFKWPILLASSFYGSLTERDFVCKQSTYQIIISLWYLANNHSIDTLPHNTMKETHKVLL